MVSVSAFMAQGLGLRLRVQGSGFTCRLGPSGRGNV